ncbi:hypothetical protein J6590_056864 [Homalodisca vitripennis]|nr:hypothetical protein J6590_056864 [Homalodisca vitripennis]
MRNVDPIRIRHADRELDELLRKARGRTEAAKRKLEEALEAADEEARASYSSGAY